MGAAAPHPVVVADRDGVIVDLNEAAVVLLAEALPGSTLDEAAPEWLARAHRELAARPHRTGHLARAGRRPVGGPIGAHSFRAHAVPDPDGSLVWWLADDTERRAAEEELRGERRRTAFLAEASNVLLATLNTDRCAQATAELAARHLAEAAVVVTAGPGRHLPLAYAIGDTAAGRTALDVDPAEVPGLDEALQGFPPLPSRWIDPAALPSWVLPEPFPGEIGSVVVTPLPGHGVAAGALILIRRAGRAAFSQGEEVFARLFAARAGSALSAARLYAEQRGITRTLMRELLPPHLEHVNGVEYAGGYRPADDRNRVGGDFYDVHPGNTADDDSLVVLGDVCGKGLDAAVLTGKIRNTLQALKPLADDHIRLLRLLNGALLNSHHTRFATLVLGSVTRREHQVELRLTAAGHAAPLIVRGDGRVEEVDTRGTLVGALPDIHAQTAEAVLRPGETCLLYTDGITEARGGPLGDEMFGEERLKDALAACAGMPAEAVVEHVQMLTTQWLRRRSHDDMAVVAITAPRTRHLSAVGGHTRGRYTA